MIAPPVLVVLLLVAPVPSALLCLGRGEALIVLDDLWNPRDAEWFRLGGGEEAEDSIALASSASSSSAKCHVLVTTRLHAPFTSASRMDLTDSVTEEEALALLLPRSEEAEAESTSRNVEAIALRVAGRVGRHPAALSSCSRWVRFLQEPDYDDDAARGRRPTSSSRPTCSKVTRSGTTGWICSRRWTGHCRTSCSASRPAEC